MSLNQVINGVDEIITGTPKYNITDNGDGTKGIELANEVVQQGTPIAKQVLDKIDNVLSYLTPSVEKVEGQVKEYSGVEDITPINILNEEKSTSSTTEYLILDYTPETPQPYIKFNASVKAGGRTNSGSIYFYLQLEDGTQKGDSIIFSNYTSYSTLDLTFNSLSSKVVNIKVKLQALSGGTQYCNNINIIGLGIPQYDYQNQFTLDNNGTSIKEIVPVEKTQIENNLFAQNITPSWSVSSSTIYSIGNSIDLILKSFTKENTTIIPSINITTTSSGFEAGGQYGTNNKVKVQSSIGSAYESSSAKFLSNFNNTENDYTNKDNLFWISSGDEINIKFDMKDIFDIKFKYRINFSKVNAKWQGSNDGTNWVDIETIQRNVASILVSNQYRYYNINAVATSNGYFAIGYLYLNELKFNYIDYEEQYIYIPFTNNQRVLVETDKNVEEITVYDSVLKGVASETTPQSRNVDYVGTTSKTLKDNTNPIMYYNLYTLWYNGTAYGYESNWENSYFNYFLNSETENTNYKIDLAKTSNYIKFDLINPRVVTLNYDIQNGHESRLSLQGSNNDIDWVNIINGNWPSIKGTYTTTTPYRYLRVIPNAGGDIYLYYLYLTNISSIIQAPAPYSDISSNTLNGIDIPTILQPSTKYELIYDETNHKFNLGGNLPLFDITLSEAVNQVDLAGIYDNLDFNKVYALIINGTTNSTNASINFGKSSVTESNAYNQIKSPVIFQKYNSNIDSDKSIGFINIIGSSSSNFGTSSLSDNGYNREYIKCASSSSTFDAGTRIIIKEIS